VKQKSTEALEIIENYPGTNSVDNQGPTPGVAGGTWLTLDSPLQPFTKSGAGAAKVYYTSKDLVNIRKLLEPLPPATHATHSVRISGLNKNNIAGSHQLIVYGLFPGETERRVLAVESVLSRWHTNGCQNCQTTSNVKRYAPLYGLPDGLNATPGGGDSDDEALQVSVEVVTRAGSGPGRNDPPLKPVFSVVGRGEKYADFL
jgi:tyrosinase